MSEPILKISQLTARVEEKEILHDINFEMRKGETHVLMGPNGAFLFPTLSEMPFSRKKAAMSVSGISRKS